jgi:DNA-binding response OmpR family regulator
MASVPDPTRRQLLKYVLAVLVNDSRGPSDPRDPALCRPLCHDRPPRILIVDDEGQIRALLTRALLENGYEVVAVGDGAAGLEAVLTATDPYDLVVTNNCMPGMEGEELIARIRQTCPNLPILHLDDMSGPHQLKLPADVPNVTKPFRIETLVSRIEQMLSRAG